MPARIQIRHPGKAPRKAQPHSALVSALLEQCAAHGVLAWKNATQGVWDQAAKRFRTFTGRKGAGDIVAILPTHWHRSAELPAHEFPNPPGRLLAIEAKTGTGRQTAEQKRFQRDVEKAGGIYLLARSVDDLLALFKDLGITPGLKD